MLLFAHELTESAQNHIRTRLRCNLSLFYKNSFEHGGDDSCKNFKRFFVSLLVETLFALFSMLKLDKHYEDVWQKHFTDRNDTKLALTGLTFNYVANTSELKSEFMFFHVYVIGDMDQIFFLIV